MNKRKKVAIRKHRAADKKLRIKRKDQPQTATAATAPAPAAKTRG